LKPVTVNKMASNDARTTHAGMSQITPVGDVSARCLVISK